jgi:hypothetical protein
MNRVNEARQQVKQYCPKKNQKTVSMASTRLGAVGVIAASNTNKRQSQAATRQLRGTLRMLRAYDKVLLLTESVVAKLFFITTPIGDWRSQSFRYISDFRQEI